MRTLIAALLLLTLFGAAAATPLRLAEDAAVFGVSGGAAIYPAGWKWKGVGPAAQGQFMRLGLGVETGCGFGATLGTTLAQVGIYEASFLPATARAFMDFDPSQRLRRRTAYVLATYHWLAILPSDIGRRYVELGCGVAWTFGIISPKAELRVRPWLTDEPRVALLAGFDLGGAYVFDFDR
jgi:hypothetical protein